MRRNSTSFPKQNFELLKSIVKDKNDPLRYHQRLVYEYVLKTPWVRGLLIYHKMGAGKSILGNSICEGFIQQESDRKIIFMASKSLHNNFRDSIAQYRNKVAESEGKPITDSTEHINTHYQFISLNASNMLTQVHRAIKKDTEMNAFDDGVITADDAEEFAKLEQIGDLEHSVLVIDEAHNLFNSISNGSKNAAGLYHLIMKAKDIKVILLTGSPIVNDPFELAIAMNMIAGPLGDHTLFGEDYLDFTKYFIGISTNEEPSDDTNDLTASVRRTFIQHKDKFVNRIVGLVSYYGADDASQRALYPEQLPIIIDRVPMSGRQYAAYITARDREIEETQRGAKFSVARAPLQKPQGMSSSYRVRSRQLSNFLFPDYASKTWKNPKGYLLYEKYLDKIQDVNLRDLGSSAFSGGKDDETKMGLEIWSPKILKMLHNIQRHCPFTFIEEKLSKKGSNENIGNIDDETNKKLQVYKQFSVVARPLIRDDLEKIEKIHNTEFKDKFQMPGKNAIGFVAIADKQIITYMIIEPEKSKNSKTGHIKYMRTRKQYRGRGIATMLLMLAFDKFTRLTASMEKDYAAKYGYETYTKLNFNVVREDSKHIHFEYNADLQKIGGVQEYKQVTLIARPIEEGDLAKIEEIHNTEFKDKYVAPKKNYVGYVALADNNIVSYLIIEPETNSGHIKYMRSRKQYRGRGIATMLLTIAFDDFNILTAEITHEYAKKYGYETYTRLNFKVINKDNDFIYFKHVNPKKGGSDYVISQMTRNEIPDALEIYKKIYESPPEVDFTDSDVKVYLSKKGENIEGIGIIKPGYAAINKTRSDSNYIIGIASLGDSECLEELVDRIQKDHPKIYLKLDKTIPQSGIMKTVYENREFYVYRESDGYWYLRHIMGAKEKAAKPKKAGLGPGLIYSQFIDSGVKLVGRALQAHGFTEIKDLNDALKHKKGAAFAIISGQVDTDVRSEIVKIFNSEENKHGEHLAILLVTSTGAEGLDLKNIRHIHVMEPYWHWARIAQVLARGVRMGSHLALPESERNVQPYIYLSDYPPADIISKLKEIEHIQKQMAKEDTTDVTLYKKSVNNQKLIDSFLEAAQEASIDCPIHYGDPSSKKDNSKHCLMCMPTDEPLFIDDLDKDIKTPSRCQPLTEKTVKAKSVTITIKNDKGETTEKEFMYSIDNKTITIFEFMPDVGAYSPMYENHPLYDDLEASIRKKEKLKH